MRFVFAAQRGSDNFALPYLKYLDHARIDHVTASLEAADVLWVEWGASYAARLLRERHECFTIVRVHDWEIRHGAVDKVNWMNVDAVWFINRDAQDEFCKRLAYPRERTFFLPNAIDLAAWPLCAEGEHHIGVVSAWAHPRKRLHLAADLMDLLPDPWRMTIRVAGYHPEHPDAVDHLKSVCSRHGDRIRFEWRDPREIDLSDNRDMIDFWRDKSHTLSLSDHEGFHYAIVEGMACGCAPAILRWDWGRPDDFYDHGVYDNLHTLALWISTTTRSDQWRISISQHSAEARARELEQLLRVFMLEGRTA